MEAALSALDHFRSEVLRATTRIGWLRRCFQTRWIRQLALFTISALLMLTTSLVFPLWVLLLGPIMYGLPHLFASARYFPKLIQAPGQVKNKLWGGIAAVFAVTFLFKSLVQADALGWELTQVSEWGGSGRFDLGVLALTTFAGARAIGLGWKGTLLASVTLTPLVLMFGLHPLETTGAMVLIHNFVGFYYWRKASSTRPEKTAALFAFFGTLVGTFLIIYGNFDFVWGILTPDGMLEFAGMDTGTIAGLILPGVEDGEILCVRLAAAFAFSQSIHYYVWMKAVPDQFHTAQVPTSFRQSWSLLKSDFGSKAALFIAGATLVYLLSWAVIAIPLARLLYFSLASYHGYLEIAGIAIDLGHLRAGTRPSSGK